MWFKPLARSAFKIRDCLKRIFTCYFRCECNSQESNLKASFLTCVHATKFKGYAIRIQLSSGDPVILKSAKKIIKIMRNAKNTCSPMFHTCLRVACMFLVARTHDRTSPTAMMMENAMEVVIGHKFAPRYEVTQRCPGLEQAWGAQLTLPVPVAGKPSPKHPRVPYCSVSFREGGRLPMEALT